MSVHQLFMATRYYNVTHMLALTATGHRIPVPNTTNYVFTRARTLARSLVRSLPHPPLSHTSPKHHFVFTLFRDRGLQLGCMHEACVKW